MDNGFAGYQWDRNDNGSWKPFRTSTDGTGSSTENQFNESCSAQRTWEVPHDVGGLVSAMGGPGTFVRRYDFFFSMFSNIGSNWGGGANVRPDCRYFTAANETDLSAPWTANWAGAPSRVQSTVSRILSTEFKNSVDGIPGNNDWGSLSTWYVSAAMGLHPMIPGVGGFSVSTPRFQKITINLENGKQVVINLDKNPSTNGYISGLSINGQTWDSTWIPVEKVRNNQSVNTIDMIVVGQASNWGMTPLAATAPPSFGNQ